jgi:hypothetical protein
MTFMSILNIPFECRILNCNNVKYIAEKSHHHHHRNKHEKKHHKHRHHDKSRKSSSQDSTIHQPKPDKPGELKVKLNLKEIRSNTPPLDAATKPQDAPMKLVLQKDKTGHYSSSGHKNSHGDKDQERSRKRGYSPSGGVSTPHGGKMSRQSDLSDSAAQLERLIQRQKQNIELTKSMANAQQN